MIGTVTVIGAGSGAGAGAGAGAGSGAAVASPKTVAQFRIHWETDSVGTALASELVEITAMRLVAPAEITSTKGLVVEPALRMVQTQVLSLDEALRVR